MLKKKGPVPGKSYARDRERISRQTLEVHYEWCVKEGRCLLWANEVFTAEQRKALRESMANGMDPYDKD